MLQPQLPFQMAYKMFVKPEWRESAQLSFKKHSSNATFI